MKRFQHWFLKGGKEKWWTLIGGDSGYLILGYFTMGNNIEKNFSMIQNEQLCQSIKGWIWILYPCRIRKCLYRIIKYCWTGPIFGSKLWWLCNGPVAYIGIIVGCYFGGASPWIIWLEMISLRNKWSSKLPELRVNLREAS